MRIGIALGGGGARGLAHLAILEVLDEFGIRPQRIAGASIGAIAGAIYAAGASASDLRAAADRLIFSEHVPLSSWFRDVGPAQHWLQLIDLAWRSTSLLDADRFLEGLQATWKLSSFESLALPLTVVAADYWTRQQVVLQQGDVMTALRGSMAVPGIFAPVPMGEFLLVDGCAVNPVPFDLLFDDCDVTIAVDIMGQRTDDHTTPPNLIECLLGNSQIMQRSIVEQKLTVRRPDIYLAPDIHSVRVLEFNKAEQIYAQSQPACQQLRKALKELQDPS